VDSVELRKKIGEAAYETTKTQTIQKNIDKYADFFISIMSK
jgi:hypothetical protein